MPDLLFELGCEELPAASVRRAYGQLEREIVARLDEANVAHGDSLSMGTPRRLIVQVLELAGTQPSPVTWTASPMCAEVEPSDMVGTVTVNFVVPVSLLFP